MFWYGVPLSTAAGNAKIPKLIPYLDLELSNCDLYTKHIPTHVCGDTHRNEATAFTTYPIPLIPGQPIAGPNASKQPFISEVYTPFTVITCS